MADMPDYLAALNLITKALAWFEDPTICLPFLSRPTRNKIYKACLQMCRNCHPTPEEPGLWRALYNIAVFARAE